MVVVDRFSKGCKLVPLKGLPTAMQTAEAMFCHVFRNFGLPEDIVSDRGPQFTSRVWGSLCAWLDIAVSLSSSHHPQSNGPDAVPVRAGVSATSVPLVGEPSNVPAVEEWYRLSQEVWERAHVRLQRALPCWKLSPKFIGPFEIIRQPAHSSAGEPVASEDPPPLDIEGSPAYQVRSLLDSRRVRLCLQYLVDWEGTNFIPDRSKPGLTTTAIGAVDLQGAGGNWATVGRRCRGGRKVHRQREKRKCKSVGLRIGTLNVGTMTGKGRELADMMERRKVDILCVQETRWKGSKARSIGAGFKLFYYGVDSKRNGVGVVLKEEFVRNVLEVKRVSDRVMSLKLEIEGVMLNVVSGYAPQVGCELEEKERFWSELDEVMESIPMGERVVIGADFNGHVGEGNRGDEEVMGKFGVKERNLEGQMVVDFAKRMDMAVVNTYFQKREEHRVTYKSGGRRTQVDYILCRRGNLKEISDCKVVVGESVARQHRMVVCRMTLMVCKTKRSKIEKKTKWWKLKKEECCEKFR
ncbi:hypothetical protein QTP70_009884 [Hemibagrus guttatus]|uniref:Integrase catalytic domain-containing protein n=1 Tax=Hemibagrus guttatus TaxID=175788 RepID=A0AAE0Q059_9TELE|nr:hypothetical protein QTP70_009884 [Hemibagrus guttatus]